MVTTVSDDSFALLIIITKQTENPVFLGACFFYAVVVFFKV
jgi:hypothetical protein